MLDFKNGGEDEIHSGHPDLRRAGSSRDAPAVQFGLHGRIVEPTACYRTRLTSHRIPRLQIKKGPSNGVQQTFFKLEEGANTPLLRDKYSILKYKNFVKVLEVAKSSIFFVLGFHSRLAKLDNRKTAASVSVGISKSSLSVPPFSSTPASLKYTLVVSMSA